MEIIGLKQKTTPDYREWFCKKLVAVHLPSNNDFRAIPAPVARVRRPCGARRGFLSAASART